MDEGSRERHSFVTWNKQQVSFLEGVLRHLVSLRDDTGAIRYSTDPKARFGPFQTVECLLPFLLFPDRVKFIEDIVMMAAYVLSTRDPDDGGYRAYPEYPYWEGAAVDSTAYAIYVFALLRDLLQSRTSLRSEYHVFCDTLRDGIRDGIAFIVRNQNQDSGWGFLKNETLKLESRTYSTSLVLSALSHCSDEDVPSLGLSRRDILGSGVDYLLTNQIQTGEDAGGWSFSEYHNEPHPNISAVAVFSLTQTYHTGWRDRRVEEAIDRGVKYLTSHWTMENAKERVRYPKGAALAEVDVHKYVQPYHMLLPAALLSGELGFNDEKITQIETKISDQYQQKVERHEREPLDPSSILTAWELAETAFTLTSYYSVCNVVENCTALFANAASQYDAVVQAETRNIRIAEALQTAERTARRWRLAFVPTAIVGSSFVALTLLVLMRPEMAQWLRERTITLLLPALVAVSYGLISELIAPYVRKQLKRLLRRTRG